MRGVIISGASHINVFEDLVSRKKIYIIPNFAQDYLFRTENDVIDNLSWNGPLGKPPESGRMERYIGTFEYLRMVWG